MRSGTRTISRRLAALLLAGALACAGSGTEPIKAGPPAKVQVVSGDAQQGVVGTELATALVVRVTDANDVPVQGQSINFRVTAGGGSVFAGSAITNASGEARERWTLGTSTATEQRLEARAVDNATGAALVFASFQATALPGAAATLEKVAGDAQPGVVGQAVPVAPAVRVRNQYGNPVPGVPVTFTVTAGGGSVGTATVAANAQGLATAAWTLGTTAGAQTLAASAAGVSAASFSVVAAAGAPARLSVPTTPASAQAGVPFIVGTHLLDAYGNAVTQAGVPVTVATSTGATLLAGVTDATGNASLQVELDAFVGTYSLVVSSPGLSPASAPGISLVTGPARVLAKESGDQQADTIGALLKPLVLRVTDAGGNPIAGMWVRFLVVPYDGGHAISYNATISGPVQRTGADGRVSPTSVTLGTCLLPTCTSNLQILASQDTLANGYNAPQGLTTTFSAKIGYGQPAQFYGVQWFPFGAPTTARAGSKPLSAPAVRITDRVGNGMSGLTVNFVVTAGGGSITGATATTVYEKLGTNASIDHEGYAYLGSWTFGPVAGTNTVEARFGSLPPVVFTIVTTEAPTTLSATSVLSQTGTVGQAVPAAPTVRVLDEAGNPVAGKTVSFVVTSGGGSVTFASKATDANGVASTPWTLGTVTGVNVMEARVGTSSVGFSANAGPGAGRQICDLRVSTTVISGSYVNPSLRFGDEYCNTLTTVNPVVTVTVESGGATLLDNTPFSGSGGAWNSASLRMQGPAGPQVLRFSAPGFTAALSPVITLQAAPTVPSPIGPSAILTKVLGDAQSDTIGATLRPLVARVTDAAGNPLAGVRVKFYLYFVLGNGSGTVVQQPLRTSDASGIVSQETVVLGTYIGPDNYGPYSVIATLDTLEVREQSAQRPASRTFTLQVLPGRPVQIVDTWANRAASLPAGSTLSSANGNGISVQVVDRAGNGVDGLAMSFVVTAGGGSVTGGSVNTDSNHGAPFKKSPYGRALLDSWTLGPTPGTNRLEARFGALIPVVFTVGGT